MSDSSDKPERRIASHKHARGLRASRLVRPTRCIPERLKEVVVKVGPTLGDLRKGHHNSSRRGHGFWAFFIFYLGRGLSGGYCHIQARLTADP